MKIQFEVRSVQMTNRDRAQVQFTREAEKEDGQPVPKGQDANFQLTLAREAARKFNAGDVVNVEITVSK